MDGTLIGIVSRVFFDPARGADASEIMFSGNFSVSRQIPTTLINVTNFSVDILSIPSSTWNLTLVLPGMTPPTTSIASVTNISVNGVRFNGMIVVPGLGSGTVVRLFFSDRSVTQARHQPWELYLLLLLQQQLSAVPPRIKCDL
jgi:hypothetical protein